jgi:hypothetical protein
MFYDTGCSRGLYYKTFYGRNLRIKVFVPGKPLQPSLMFAGKTGAYPSEAPFRVGPQPHPQTLD